MQTISSPGNHKKGQAQSDRFQNKNTLTGAAGRLCRVSRPQVTVEQRRLDYQPFEEPGKFAFELRPQLVEVTVTSLY